MDFDFQWWMLLPLIPLLGISFIVFKVVRTRRRGRIFLRLSRSERLEFAKLALQDANLPLIPRAIVAGAAAYLSLPIDLIPDFIPIVGHADDFLVVTLLLAVMNRFLTRDEMEALARRARSDLAPRDAIPVN